MHLMLDLVQDLAVANNKLKAWLHALPVIAIFLMIDDNNYDMNYYLS